MKLSVIVLVCLQIASLTMSDFTTLSGFFVVAPPELAVKPDTWKTGEQIATAETVSGGGTSRRKRETSAISITTETMNKMECAILCLRDPKCKTFSFSESLKKCTQMQTKALASTKGTTNYVKDSVVTTGLSYCKKGQLEIGKFNRDGTDDLLCYDGEKSAFTVATTKVGANGLWLKKVTTNFTLDCGASASFQASPKIVARDCSGDVLSDIICFKQTAPVSVTKTHLDAASDILSFKLFKTGFRQDWCPPTARLYTEDFNGDRMADIVCHTYERTWKFFNMATDDSNDIMRSPSTVDRGCKPNESPLFGDFNSDGKTDVLCRNTVTNKLRLYRGLGDATTGTPSTEYTDAYDPCASMSIYVGKFYAKPTEGLLCHRRGTSNFKVLMLDSSSNWKEASTFYSDFCMADEAKLYIGYFYGTSKQDVMCHGPNGEIDILQNV